MDRVDRVDRDAVIPEQFELAYRALRETAGAYYLERDFVSVRGPDALGLLQSQLTQDLAPLAVGDSTESLVLSPQGHLDAYLRVTRASTDRFVLDVAAGWGPAVLERLERFRIRARAEISPLGWQCLSIRGPGTSSLVSALAPYISFPLDPEGTGEQPAAQAASAHPEGPETGFDPTIRVDASWPGLPGLDLLGPAPAVPPGVLLVSEVAGLAAPLDAPVAPWFAAWEAVRIEAGIPAMGRELTTKTIPAETGLAERTISSTKGCYTGQELVARMAARGNRAPRSICGLVLGAGKPAPAAEPWPPWPPPGSEVRFEGAARGTVTTSSFSLLLAAPVALAVVQRGLPVPSEVLVVHDGRERAASARALPLIH